MFGEQLVVQNPMRIKNNPFLQLNRVVVFDDAAYLDIRQRESLRQIFQPLGLDDRLVKSFALKVRDCASGRIVRAFNP
jgi:hypothetical protein